MLNIQTKMVKMMPEKGYCYGCHENKVDRLNHFTFTESGTIWVCCSLKCLIEFSVGLSKEHLKYKEIEIKELKQLVSQLINE